jgi:predicted CXXCH cytochrome family protein
LALVALGSLAVLAGCRAPTRRALRDFFFDVPKEEARPAVRPATVTTNPVAVALAPEPTSYKHSPFRDRRCTECHETTTSQKLRAPVTELCWRCHKTLISQARYVHAPVEAGACLVCHHQHQSPEKFQLQRSGRALCFECHEPPDLLRLKAHATIGDAACQSCHEPHCSPRNHLLKPAS